MVYKNCINFVEAYSKDLHCMWDRILTLFLRLPKIKRKINLVSLDSKMQTLPEHIDLNDYGRLYKELNLGACSALDNDARFKGSDFQKWFEQDSNDSSKSPLEPLSNGRLLTP